MSDEFFIVPFVVRAAGTDVPPEQIQAAINSICQQVTADLNLIVSGGFPQTNVDITGGTITGVTGATQPTTDNSLLLATDQFVNQQIINSTRTVPLTLAGGTYNQATLGSGFSPVVLTSGGVVQSILTIATAGAGYAVGDLITLAAGNDDAVLRVTAVSGGGVTAASILYGGTDYSNGAQVMGTPIPPGDRNVEFTGVLTSNVTFIISAGTFNTASRRVSFANNTTGGFTVTVFLSNGADGTVGSGYVLPQGTANSTSVLLQTDGETNVWPVDSPAGIGAAGLASPAFTGTPIAPTAAPGTSTTQLATTAFVATSFAPLASPALTGTPTAPTATGGTSTTQLATTAFVASAIAPLAPLASPALTGTPTAPTAAAGTSTTQLATTAFVQGIAQGRLLNVQVITATGTYTPTAGTNSVLVELLGGGGAGGGAPSTGAGQVSAGGGASAGGRALGRFTSSFSGVTVTIGAGGTGVSGAAGNAGGNSSFGALMTANGGGAGLIGAASATAAFGGANAGGTCTGGTIANAQGAQGLYCNLTTTGIGVSGQGASTVYGSGGIYVGTGVTGSAATGKGSGGGGTVNGGSSAALTGGAGMPGVCVVWEYA